MPKPPRTCPNPLFAQWLCEWRDQAAQDGRLRRQQAYERALESLHKYPLPLRSGREARLLQYFGEKICHQLDQRLERHLGGQALTGVERKRPDLEAPASSGREEDGDPPTGGDTSASGAPGVHALTAPARKPGQQAKEKPPALHKRGRSHLPPPRSAAYAVLLALYRDRTNPSSRGYLTKPELQRAAQPLCDKSFSLVAPGSKNTAWPTVGALIRKELVLKTNIPARYSLTEAGVSLAQQLGPLDEARDSIFASSSAAAAGTRGPPLLLLDGEDDGAQEGGDAPSESGHGEPRARRLNPQFVLHPGQFEIILCVDFIETTGGPTSRKQDLVQELQRHNVSFSIRKLHVGDFLWVARERGAPVAGERQPIMEARELVLDYVVERKRMSDLCSSIMDGRFREQKFRLRQCGVSHPVYLVEDTGSGQHLSLPETTLQQAMVNTQVVDNFFVKRTRDIRESAAYLTLMTRHLARLYGDRTLLSCTKEDLEQERPLLSSEGSCHLLTFAEFNEGAVKNKAQTVREVFARQLMQVGGVSGEKALAILERFETPASLLAAYAACPSPQEQEHLLSRVRCGKLQRNFGPVLSRALAQLYCTPGPLP